MLFVSKIDTCNVLYNNNLRFWWHSAPFMLYYSNTKAKERWIVRKVCFVLNGGFKTFTLTLLSALSLSSLITIVLIMVHGNYYSSWIYYCGFGPLIVREL